MWLVQTVSKPDVLAEHIDRDLHALAGPSVAAMRAVRRRWSAVLRKCPAQDTVAVALALFERFGHRWIAYEILLFHPSALTLIGPDILERFAGELRSWGDVDQFGILLAGPAWRAGQIDDSIVHEWATSPDRWWRRAALVATVPLNTRSRGGFGDVVRSLTVCSLLLDDRDDLVVKGLSWTIRELIVHDRRAVEAFLESHDTRLAARVKREVRSKLSTGLKQAPTRSGTGRPTA